MFPLGCSKICYLQYIKTKNMFYARYLVWLQFHIIYSLYTVLRYSIIFSFVCSTRIEFLKLCNMWLLSNSLCCAVCKYGQVSFFLSMFCTCWKIFSKISDFDPKFNYFCLSFLLEKVALGVTKKGKILQQKG